MKKIVNNLLSLSILFLILFVICLAIQPLRSLAFGAFTFCAVCFLLFGSLSNVCEETERLQWLLEESEIKTQALEQRIRELENSKKK